MTRTGRTAVRCWRWRRNALKRRIDVVEAWLVLVAWACAVAGGVLTGPAAGNALHERLDRQHARQQTVSAVLLGDAHVRTDGRSGVGHTAWATARWVGADGHTHRDRVRVDSGASAGDRLTVWTDGQGRLTGKPLSGPASIAETVVTGVSAAVCVGLVVLGCGTIVRGLLDGRRLRQWAEEWEHIDSQWGGTTV